uniref:DUF6503 family protein n=1 Tax=Roseivirga sp. TaxID=1964215 RepID=UPI0040477CA7
MRYVIFLWVSLFFVSCKSPVLDANTIVAKAYEAHGGKDAWDRIGTLRYQKESTVYNADGSTRVQSLQDHDYTMQPTFSAVVKWNEDTSYHQITLKDGIAKKWINVKELIDEKVRAAAEEAVYTALYTVSQPFKLSDPGVILSFEGEDVLEEGQAVYVVKASYNTANENHTQSDEWWYFFDQSSYLCLATMVHHGSTYSYIKNLEFDHTTDIIFNGHRKGYAVDSVRKILYHQSEYFYRNYQIQDH